MDAVAGDVAGTAGGVYFAGFVDAYVLEGLSPTLCATFSLMIPFSTRIPTLLDEFLNHAISTDQRNYANQHLIHYSVLSLGDKICLAVFPGQGLDQA